MAIIAKVMVEGPGLGAILVFILALGIRCGAVGMVHLFNTNIQERAVSLGLITKEQIKKNAVKFKSIGMVDYIAYVLICVYGINQARGFAPGFWQMFAILFIMDLVDRLLVDEYWVGHTKAWNIPGAEDLRPYITTKEKTFKWIIAPVVWVVVSAVLSGIMYLLVR